MHSDIVHVRRRNQSEPPLKPAKPLRLFAPLSVQAAPGAETGEKGYQRDRRASPVWHRKKAMETTPVGEDPMRWNTQVRDSAKRKHGKERAPPLLGARRCAEGLSAPRWAEAPAWFSALIALERREEGYLKLWSHLQCWPSGTRISWREAHSAVNDWSRLFGAFSLVTASNTQLGWPVLRDADFVLLSQSPASLLQVTSVRVSDWWLDQMQQVQRWKQSAQSHDALCITACVRTSLWRFEDTFACGQSAERVVRSQLQSQPRRRVAQGAFWCRSEGRRQEVKSKTRFNS